MKTSIIIEMQSSDQVVHTIRTSDANDLITAGYVRSVNVSPQPPRGKTAVNLTIKGRGHRTGATVAAPVTPDTTDE